MKLYGMDQTEKDMFLCAIGQKSQRLPEKLYIDRRGYCPAVDNKTVMVFVTPKQEDADILDEGYSFIEDLTQKAYENRSLISFFTQARDPSARIALRAPIKIEADNENFRCYADFDTSKETGMLFRFIENLSSLDKNLDQILDKKGYVKKIMKTSLLLNEKYNPLRSCIDAKREVEINLKSFSYKTDGLTMYCYLTRWPEAIYFGNLEKVPFSTRKFQHVTRGLNTSSIARMLQMKLLKINENALDENINRLFFSLCLDEEKKAETIPEMDKYRRLFNLRRKNQLPEEILRLLRLQDQTMLNSIGLEKILQYIAEPEDLTLKALLKKARSVMTDLEKDNPLNLSNKKIEEIPMFTNLTSEK